MDEGRIETLVELIAGETEEQKENAALALGRAAYISDDDAAEVSPLGIKVLVELLYSGTERQREKAAVTVGILAKNNKNSIEIERENGIVPLAAFLETWSNEKRSETLEVNSAVALASLARNSNNSAEIGNLGTIRDLASIVATGTEVLQESAALALGSLAGIASNRVQIAQVGGIPALVKLTYTGTEQLKERAEWALKRLAVPVLFNTWILDEIDQEKEKWGCVSYEAVLSDRLVVCAQPLNLSTTSATAQDGVHCRSGTLSLQQLVFHQLSLLAKVLLDRSRPSCLVKERSKMDPSDWNDGPSTLSKMMDPQCGIDAMGLKSTRPLPLAHAELALAPFFKKRFRSWHLSHVRLALQRYRLLTSRGCVDSLQLGHILGLREATFLDQVLRLFLPRTPTRVQCMVDVMEVLVALALVCQAPNMLSRFELIFDVVDVENKGAISSTDLILMCGTVGRAIMKLFEYKVEPEQYAMMEYVTDVLDVLSVARNGKIPKNVLCKFMLSDRFAVHYVKQCTGQDKPKLYVMLEKDAEFLGAVEFSNEQHMQTTSLKAVRDMIYAQVDRVPEDFTFLCQGREVDKVWEVDRRAWSVVPFALRGSPGLRSSIHAKNRRLERPAVPNPFEFRYMGNCITRYKKCVHEIRPVHKHRSFRLRKNEPRKRLEPVVEWRVSTSWSGDWIYEQSLMKARSKAKLVKRLRAIPRPQSGIVVVKSHFGDIVSPQDIANVTNEHPTDSQLVATPVTPNAEKRMQRIESMSLRERKREDLLLKQQVQWQARVLAMEEQHQLESKRSNTSDGASDITTMMVHIGYENTVPPSRLIQTEQKKRPRPKKLEWAKYRWDVPGRLLSSLPPQNKKLKVSMISDNIRLNTPAGSSANRQITLGRFLCSTNVSLEENQVEVFPVLVIRPIEELVPVSDNAIDIMDDEADASIVIVGNTAKKPLVMSKSYLTEFEYEINATESNFEVLYQHIVGGTMADAIWLNRRDVLGRTMLHDAAEFGHSNIMDVLLKVRVVVNARDSRGDTALHHAARHGRLKEVSILLREHAVPWQLNYEGKSPLYCALETAGKRSSRPVIQPANSTTDSLSIGDDRKHFFLANRTYPQLRQVIDLLWDHYSLEHLMKSDCYDRSNCLELEKQVYGDMIDSCHDGNLLRVQRLVDLEKRPVLGYINAQMKILQRTALHEAAEQGHTATVDLLLKLGADGYIRDQRDQTPLHLAAYKGYDNIVKCLISKFPQTATVQDISGCTPLHLAIQKQHWSIVTDLVEMVMSNQEVNTGRQRHSLDLQDVHGYTPLHYACVHGHHDTCAALLKAQAAPSISQLQLNIPKGTANLLGFGWKGDKFRTARIRDWKSGTLLTEQQNIVDIEAPVELLLRGCKQNCSNFQARLSVLEILVRSHDEYYRDLDGTDRFPLVKTSHSPLYHIAAEIADTNISLSVEICRRLSGLHIEINMTHPRTHETVLLQECKRICARGKRDIEANGNDTLDELALARSLLELGANTDLANEVNGESPLGCAAWNGNLALLDLLLEAGADKNCFLRRRSFSPLHFAALGSNTACARMLIGHSAVVNVEMPPANAETPLFFAIRSRSEEMVDLLLRSGADPCSLCTLQQGLRTSFGIVLSVPVPNNRSHNELSLTETGSAVVSPLSFALIIAQSVRAFSIPEELDCTTERASKCAEWLQMERICVMLAKQLLIDNESSKGAVTRNDVYLASVLGYWELLQILLSQQVALSNAPSTYTTNALHHAAAAGKTKIVTALVAGGMNVNCVVRREPPKSRRFSSHKAWYPWVGCGSKGALFYALIHGHVETAAKLLVLGANPEETIPLMKKKFRLRRHVNKAEGAELYEHDTIRFFISEAMEKKERTKVISKNLHSIYDQEDKGSLLKVDGAAVNFIHLLECSINQRVPLFHLVVALGHTSLVQVLVDSGMSIFSGFTAPPSVRTNMAGWNAPEETPIHIAIACGHLEIVQQFASVVQNHFPECFVLEGKAFGSLLVTACKAHQIIILRFLLGDNQNEVGGGFTYEACKEEFQSALNTCAAVQFEEGFRLLVKHGAKPNVHTLVSVLKGITYPRFPFLQSAYGSEISMLEKDEHGHYKPFHEYCAPFLGQRHGHTFETNSVARATDLLQLTLASEFIAEISDFVGSSPIFDVVHTILTVSSYHQLWFVLHEVFVQHKQYFIDVASIWKPILIRSASCCFVLHRAAKSNQVNILAFFLKIGVPYDVRVGDMAVAKPPIWYAASRGSLEAFICLALRSPLFVKDLPKYSKQNAVGLVFRSIHESRSYLATSNSACKWQNLGVFGCIDVPKRQTNGFLIQKFVNYGLSISRGHVDTSLLHHASRRGELLAVQALIDNGADVTTVNKNGETALEVASKRKDPLGYSVVNCLLITLARKEVTDASSIIERSLVCCVAEPPPCNLKILKALLEVGANTLFSRDATEEEMHNFGPIQISAMFYAMQSAQYGAVKLLLDHGAQISIHHTEVFLSRFSMDAQHKYKRHWRRFSSFIKTNSQLLVEVEGIMKTLLQKEVFARAMNPDLVQQLLTSSTGIAATIARQVDVGKNFWSIAHAILDRYPKEISSRKAEWNQKAALHYAVISAELPTITKLLELRGSDILAEDESKQTPLHLAAIGGEGVICRLLLEKLQSNKQTSLAVDVRDSYGRTALHLAVIHGHEEAAIMLTDAGTSLSVRCNNGLTAYMYAAKCNRLAILIALYARARSKSHDIFQVVNGEHAIFVAARHTAFSVVRWFINLLVDGNLNDTSSIESPDLFGLRCQFERTVLHYAAIHGDDETLGLLLKMIRNAVEGSSTGAMVNARDGAGYTPLMYAFAFGRLRAVSLLCEFGADPFVGVNHSGAHNAHPYTVGFDIADLLHRFALPGWYSHVCKHLPSQEKARLVRAESIDEDYLWNSSYSYRKKSSKRPIEWRSKWKKLPPGRLLKSERPRRGKDQVRTSMRTWRFPTKSLFDYSCEIGNSQMTSLLMGLKLPQVFQGLSYQTQRRNFMQAVRWNRVEVVKALVASSTGTDTEIPTGNHFSEFLEIGVDCAASRGLEDMAITLLTQWKGFKDNGDVNATENSFAFQFAPAFQIACIRRMPKLVAYMIGRGGEQLVDFPWNEGSALVYAFAFGHSDIAELLLNNGADPTIGTYSAPSLRKWAEFGSPKNVEVAWQSKRGAQGYRGNRPPFIGPIEAYNPETERFSIDKLGQAFDGMSLHATALGNKSTEPLIEDEKGPCGNFQVQDEVVVANDSLLNSDDQVQNAEDGTGEKNE